LAYSSGSHLFGLLSRGNAFLQKLRIPGRLGFCILLLRDIARQVGSRKAQLRGVPSQHRLHLAQLCLERARVDRKQQVALLNGLAFFEEDTVMATQTCPLLHPLRNGRPVTRPEACPYLRSGCGGRTPSDAIAGRSCWSPDW